MASLYSTATLGLRLDTTSFNSALQAAGRTSRSIFDGLSNGANQFKEAWDDATRGIKDTKRIISGILISQGFYGIMNGLTDAGSAALTFSMNMETAAVSMEYFMQGTDKAAKALAYLREINDFAAHTPFTTEAALELSKYVQAVGIGTQYTKSFLSVVTDAAAATGATTENLERVVFALGQMKTKGRIANEEIRQLANANIPIYEILQEELGLTGDQISNIGKYWVDADKAIVAILTGLDKRYGGAADRISNTVTGMLDTIRDDALIITQEAGSDIYDAFAGTLTKIRDKLDEYRDVATELGGFGLLNHVMLEIDPSGEFGTELLVLVGNVQQLMSALKDLYISSQPVIKLFGKGLYSGINTASIVMTSFSRIIEGTEKALDKLGVTSGTLGTSLGKLYVMYQAGKWALTLGQGAAYAGTSLVNMGSSIVTGLVPALNAGSVSAAGLLANLLALAGVAAGVYALISGFNSFAGLDITTGDVFPTDYEAAMNDYLAAMDEYNQQIAQYQSQFNSPFTEMTDGSEAAIEALDDTAKASKKAAGSVKNDWVAAFDEVYQVPTDKGGGGSGTGAELPDLGKLLTPPKFKFPGSIGLELKKPELEDFFDGALLDDTTLNQDWFKSILPALIAAGVLGAAAHFKKPNYDVDAGKGPKDATRKPADAEVRKLAEKLVDEIESYKKQAQLQTDELRKAIEDKRNLNKSLDSSVETYKQLQGTMKKLEAAIDKRQALTGSAVKAMPIDGELKQLLDRFYDVSNQYTSVRAVELEQRIKEGLLLGAELENTQKELKQLNKSLTPLDKLVGGAATRSTIDLRGDFDTVANDLFSKFEQLDTDRVGSGLISKEQSMLIEGISADMKNLLSIGDTLVDRNALQAGDSVRQADRLYSYLVSMRGDVNKLINKGTGIISALGSANNSVDVLARDFKGAVSPSIRKLQEESAKTRTLLTNMHKDITGMSDATVQNSVAVRSAIRQQQQADAEARRAAEIARKEAQAAKERRRVAAAIANESTSSRFLSGDELSHIIDSAVDELLDGQSAADLPGKLAPTDALKSAIDNLTYLTEQANDQAKIQADYENQLIDDVRRYLSDYRLQTGATSMPAELQSVVLEAFNVGGISEEDWRAFLRIFAKNDTNIDAVQLLNTALRDAIGRNAMSTLTGHPSGNLAGILTEGDASKLSFGLGAFEGGLGDVYARALASVNSDYAAVIERSASANIEVAAAIGRYTQNLGLMASKMKWGANGAELSAGGYKLTGMGDMLLQIDGELRIIRNAANELIPATITSMSQRNVEALTDGAKWIAKANDTPIRTISSSTLRAVNPDAYARIGYQISATPNGTSGALSVLNRDFALVADRHANALNRFITAFKGATYMEPVNAAPFSIENVNKFANSLPSLKDADASTKMDAYMRRVVLPTFNVPEYALTDFEEALKGGMSTKDMAKKLASLSGQIDFTALNDFYETFIVDYTKDQLKALNSVGNIAAAKQIQKLITEASSIDNVADALGTFVKFTDKLTDLGGQVALINSNNSWRQIGKMSKSTKSFVDNILKVQSSLDGYLSTSFRNMVDSAIAEYQFDIARATTPEKAARVTEFFKDRLTGFANSLRGYIDGSADVLLRGSTMTKASMEVVATALDTLAANPLAVDKVPMLVRSVIDNTNKLNAVIDSNATATELTKTIVRQLANDSEALLNTLGSMSDIGISGYFDNLTAMYDRISRALADREEIALKSFGRIDPLVSGLSAADSLEYYKNLINGTDASTYATNRLPRPETTPAKYIVDTETTGLFSYNTTGRVAPNTLQVAYLDVETGEVGSFYVTRGAEEDIKGLNGIKKIEDVGDAWRNVSLEQFQAGAIPEEQVNAVLKRLLSDSGISGYNATNVNRIGGGYDYKVITDNFNLKLNAVSDVMSQASDVFERTLGTRTTFKLSELAEVIAGAAPSGAHEAGADVKMTQFVAKNIANGRLEEVIRTAMLNGINRGGLKSSLTTAAGQLNSMGRLPDNLLGSSGARIDFDIPGLPKAASEVVSTPVIQIPELPPHIVEIPEDSIRVTAQIDDIFEPVSEAGKLAGEASEAARAAGKSDNIYSLIRQFFNSRFGGGDWEAFKDNFTTFRERVSNPFSSRVSNAAGKGVQVSIDDAYSALYNKSAELKMPELRQMLHDAQANRVAGVGNDKAVRAAQQAYDEALKEYKKEAKQFFRTVTDQLSGAVEGFKAPTDFVHAVDTLSRSSDDLVAMFIDPKTGIPSLVGGALHTSGQEIFAVAQQYVINQLKASGVIAKDAAVSYDKILNAFGSWRRTGVYEAAANLAGDVTDINRRLFDAFLEIERVATTDASIDTLSEMARKLYRAMDEFGSRVVVTGAESAMFTINELGEAVKRLEDVRWAGNAAKQGIETAADTVGTAFKSLGSRLVNGVANFGIIDVAVATLQGGLQRVRDTEYAGALQSGLTAENIGASTLADSGYNIGSIIGNDVFHGALQEFSFGIANGITSSLTITAVTPIVTSAISAKLGGAIGSIAGPIGTAVGIGVGILAGMLTDAAVDAMGGHTLTNLYLDDYVKALNEGPLINTDRLKDMASALGMSSEEIAKFNGNLGALAEALKTEYGVDVAALEDRIRAQTTALTMGSADYSNRLERDNINSVLYGTGDKKKRDVTDEANSTAIALRVIAGLGLEGITADMFNEHGLYYVDGRTPVTTLRSDLVNYNEETGVVEVNDPGAIKALEKLLGVNIEIRELSSVAYGHEFGLYNADTGEAIAASFENLSSLEEVFRLMYQQGNTGSDIATAMDTVLASNVALRQALEKELGSGYTALGLVRDNLESYVNLYNSAAGTEYSLNDINSNYQLGEAIMTWAAKILEDNINQVGAQLNVTRANRPMTAADLTAGGKRIFWGGSLSEIDSSVLDGLADIGINLIEYAYDINNTLTDAYEQSYLTLTANMDKLAEHIAGVTIEPNLSLTDLNITAQDAEILAQAGIQINSDGTVTFMKAENEGSSGATRDLTLGSSAVSQDIKDALEKNDVYVDFDSRKNNLTLGANAVTEKNLYGAMFAMPSGWDKKTSDKVQKAFKSIGKVMDSGYVMITNKAILSGQQTVRGYMEGILGDTGISDDVGAFFDNFDSVFQYKGNAAIENIRGWANAVVIPSFISQDDLTPEIEAAFAAAGITFTEYGDEFLMVINEFGENLKNGITRIDAETWDKLPEDVRGALTEMGVEVKRVGNQVMVDLSNIFEGGAANVVSVFVDRPELWEQIPEALRATLEDTLFATEDGFLEIKNRGHDSLVQINGKWVGDMGLIKDEFIAELAKTNPEAAAKLSKIVTTFNDGLVKVEQVFDEHDISDLAKNELVVPFADLPQEIRDSLTGPGGLEGELDGALFKVSGVAHSGFQSIVAEATAGASGVGAAADSMVKSITDAITQAGIKLKELERLGENAGKSGGFLGIGGAANYMDYGTSKKVMSGGKEVVAYALRNGQTGTIIEWRYTDPYTGKMRTAATGTDYSPGGTTLVGELGREMAILPDGSIKMLGANGKGELVDLPRGSQVLTNEDTEEVLKYTGSISSVRKLAEGNTELIVTDGAAAQEDSDPAEDNFREIFLAFMKAFIAKYGSTVDDSESDITTENYDSIDSAAHFVAEHHAVAIRGYSAALFEILESWRNDKSGLEALGNKLDASIVDNSAALLEAIQKADADIVDAIRNIKLSSSSSRSYNSDSDYDSEYDWGIIKDTDDLHFWNSVTDDEPYNWIADVIQAQQMWAEATTEAEREAAHAFAEAARATQGFSGGADGTQFIATGGAQADWVKEVFAAKAQYAAATTDDERAAAHARAETARATQGFTGGVNGTSFALTDSLENIIAAMRSVQDNTDKTEENVTTLNNDLEAEINEAFSKWSAQDLSTAQLIDSTIIAGCDEVAGAVGSYVSWSQSEIASLKSELSSMKMAASQTERSSASVSGSIKGSASGSLVTKDALYRAGELGLNEAIIPLERPNVMSLVGSTIADYMPEGEGATVVINDQQSIAAVINEQTETLAVAIRGAVAAIAENQVNHSDRVVAAVEKIIDTVDGNLKALDALESLGSLNEPLNTLNESIANIGGLLETSNAQIQSILAEKATSTDIALIPSALTAEFGQWWTTALSDARSMYNSADNDADRMEAHARAEDLRAMLGYSGGVDGSQVIPLQRAGYTFDMDTTAEILEQFSAQLTELTSQEWNEETTRDKEETETQSTDMRSLTTATADGISTISAMLQTTGGSIISAIGSGASMVASAVGSYVSWSQSEISSLRSELSSMKMAASQTERGSTSLSGIKGSASGSLVTEDALYRAGEMGLNEAIIPLEKPEVMSLVGSTIAKYMPEGAATVVMNNEASVIGAIIEQTETIVVAIRGAVAAILEGMNSQNLLLSSLNSVMMGNVSDSASKITTAVSSSKATSSLGSGWDTGPDSLLARDAAAGTLRNAWPDYDGDLPLFGGGTSAGTKAQKYIDAGVKYSDPISVSVAKLNGTYKAKGSARGSLITQDALYRAGELGLNEAIIPLERPDVLQQVGASIASFMPVEQRQSMSMVAGMQNGGVSPIGEPVVQQQDPNMMISAITQSVLESVLPAMASMNDEDVSDRRPLYVGTLVADERGLQALERKLYDIRKMEATRR